MATRSLLCRALARSPPSAATSSDTRSSAQLIKQQPRSGRRQWVLHSFALFALTGSDDPVTIVNSVLSGYGLPTLNPQRGLKSYDRIEDEFTFDYPRSWVIARNRIRGGLYISDFKTADKITVEIFPDRTRTQVGSEAFIEQVVAKFVSPGEGQQNDRLELPPSDKIQTSTTRIDGIDYLYLDFPSSTITRSGYQVKRLNTAVAALQDSTVYALCASTRSEETSPEKAVLFQAVIQSFRLK